MEFQVSARKWRPQKFEELIGQEHIVRTLSNAIELDRVSHAYLFSGTRGVGKTTSARIFAKALNCVNGPTPSPCDACDFCNEIRNGNSIDVQEIDGASNNSVAEVRDLIESIQYATSACRYKVYIIDEVHMLSKAAFNALLKTLEEPPQRVVFIFATTELGKIPETILSRCQCFEFKPLSHKQIIRQLELICDHENISIDSLSVEEIAKNGAGSMRDAQSLLDQVVAYCGKEIKSGAVESVLGIVGQKTLEGFVDHLISRNPGALIAQIQEVAAEGKDLNFFCRDLTEYLRHLLMVKVSDKPETLLDTHTCNLEALRRQADAFHADEIQQMFNLLSRTEMDMKRSSLPQMVFEMAVLRLSDARPFRKIDELIDKINQLGPLSAPEEVEKPANPGLPATNPPASNNDADSLWEQVSRKVCDRKSSFEHYFHRCRVVDFQEDNIHLSFEDEFTLGLVQQQDNVELLRKVVKEVSGRDVNVKLTLQDAGHKPDVTGSGNKQEKKKPNDYNNKEKGQMTESEIIQDALEIFGGVVIR